MLPLLLFAAAIGVVAPLYARARSPDPSRIFFNWYGVFLVAGTTLVWVQTLVSEAPPLGQALLLWPFILFLTLLGTMTPAFAAVLRRDKRA